MRFNHDNLDFRNPMIPRRNPATPDDLPGTTPGMLLDPAVASSPAFRRWFDGSVVVHWDGSPRVMYHGSFFSGIDRFRSNRVMDEVSGWFAFDPEFASRFSAGSEASGTTYPVVLSIRRLFDIRSEQDQRAVGVIRPLAPAPEDHVSARQWSEMSIDDRLKYVSGAALGKPYAYDWNELEQWNTVMAMKKAGFEGYLDFEVSSRRPPTAIAVFDAGNVKSVFNKGTWDRSLGIMNPVRIRRETGRNIDFSTPPSDADAKAALVSANGNKLVGGRPIGSLYGAARDLPEGTPVDLRIDIPTFNRRGVYVVTIHKPKTRAGGPGDVVGYDSIARVADPVFIVGRDVSRIYEGRSAKFPVATVHGKFSREREMPQDIESWTPVGFDPHEHAFFYDKRSDMPVLSGSEAISVGNTVFVKDPVYGDPNSFPNPRRRPREFPFEWADALRRNHPGIWRAGGNIRGNETFRLWTRRRRGERSPAIDHWWDVERPAWIARHFDDHRLPGVVAQIKWGAVGRLGVAGMKQVVEEAIRRGR